MMLPGCCYCFDVGVPDGYNKGQLLTILHDKKDTIPHEVLCRSMEPPEVSDIFVWDNQIRVIQEMFDRSYGAVEHLYELSTQVLNLPEPSYGLLVKKLNGEDDE